MTVTFIVIMIRNRFRKICRFVNTKVKWKFTVPCLLRPCTTAVFNHTGCRNQDPYQSRNDGGKKSGNRWPALHVVYTTSYCWMLACARIRIHNDEINGRSFSVPIPKSREWISIVISKAIYGFDYLLMCNIDMDKRVEGEQSVCLETHCVVSVISM